MNPLSEYPMRLAKAAIMPFTAFLPTPKQSSIEDLRTADAIVGVPFGTHGKGMPIGNTNAAIAINMILLQNRYLLPCIAQWEMEDSRLRPDFDLVIGKRWDPHIPTDAFFEELRSKRPDYKRLIIVAHQDHMRRCAMVWKKMGGVPIIPWLIPMPFDPTSLHPQARSRSIFMCYEPLALGYFALTGKI